jgi:Rrf2 family protein
MLTATTKHALRALVHLSRVPDGQSILGRDLAEQAKIPANFLAKILLTLRNAGFVEATRGFGGGYRLARDAHDIRLIQIADLFEGASLRKSECFLGEKRTCNDKGGCSAHPAWKRVREVFLDFLNTQSIADIGGSETVVVLQSGGRGRSRK